jgi:preprotein translocase SecE subunit
VADGEQERDEPGEGDASETEEGLSQPLRGDLPGSLDHASGADDEFDAAIVAGAGGEEFPEREFEREVDELERSGGERRKPAAAGEPEHHGNRVIGFLRASWAELQRVQWPDRRQVFQATAVVIGFVAVAGLYLGLADLVAKEIVEQIL